MIIDQLDKFTKKNTKNKNQTKKQQQNKNKTKNQQNSIINENANPLHDDHVVW